MTQPRRTQVLGMRTRLLPVAVCLSGLLCFASAAFAARQMAQDTSPPADATHRVSSRGDFRIDITEPPEVLKPVRGRTPDDEKRLQAVAWFLKGRFLEQREDFKAALDAYEKSLDLNPTATEVYQVLIPLAFGLNDSDLAIKHALRAIELSPDDFQTLKRVAIHLASKQRIPESLKMLEQASQSKKLQRLSGDYVLIMRDLGMLYLLTDQAGKAADAFEVVLDAKIDPDKYHLEQQLRADLEKHERTKYEAIGQVFLEAKRPDRAIIALERAAKAKRTKPGAIAFSLAQAYLMTGKPDQALEQLQVYLDAQLQSKGKTAYQLLAEILKAQGKSDDLITRLEQLAEKDQHNLALQFYLAQQYVVANKLDEAEKLLKKTLEREKSIEGYVGLAALYRKQNRPAELLQALAQAFAKESELEKVAEDLERELQAISADEKLVAGLLEVGKQQMEGDAKLDFGSSLLLGKIAAQNKQLESADKFYRFALKLRRDRANGILAELGRHYLLANQFDEAAKVFKEATSDPTLANSKPNFLFLLSQAEEMGGHTEAALAAITEAQKLLPNHPQLDFQEAWVHYHAHQWDLAVPLFEKVIEKHKETELVRKCKFSLSNIHVQRGDIRKGEEILEQVLVEAPDDPSVNNDLGYLYADQGKNLEQALSMIEKALKAEPDNAAYQDSMAWVLFKLGRAQDALPFLEKAIKSPRGADATIWDHLGDIQDKLGDKAKAVENWEKALKDAQADKRPDPKLIEKLQGKLKK